jgi:hypothetical protein
MPNVSSYPDVQTPARQSTGRTVGALVAGILAIVSFVVLALPTDLILFDLPGFLRPIGEALYPLALGPEILFSPLGLIIAIAAIALGARGLSAASAKAGQGAGLARAGLVLGWLATALYLLSFGLVILSFMGVVKPLI